MTTLQLVAVWAAGAATVWCALWAWEWDRKASTLSPVTRALAIGFCWPMPILLAVVAGVHHLYADALRILARR